MGNAFSRLLTREDALAYFERQDWEGRIRGEVLLCTLGPQRIKTSGCEDHLRHFG